MSEILVWLVTHRNKLFKAVLGLSVAFLLVWGITLSRTNKKLSESLEMALNNIEAYLGSISGLLLANNVLKLSADELQAYNDKLLHQIDSVRAKLKIKPKYLHTAATQTLDLHVTLGEKLKDTIRVDSVYEDTINFNEFTSVSYLLSKDSIYIDLSVSNRQYLFVYKDKHYKNKKSFLKRLFTWDFKKVTTYKYDIINENDLIHTDSVRVVEITE